MPTLSTPDWESNERDGRELFNRLKAEIETLDISASQNPVADKDLTAPPGTPAAGDRYIVAATATGAWVGQETQIALWDGTAWVFVVPDEGFRVYVQDEDQFYLFDGTAWAVDTSTSGVSALDDLSDVAITTPASGQVLRNNGSGWINDAIQAGDITSGQLALARGGTNADLSATGGAGQVLKQVTAGAAVTVAAIQNSDLPTAQRTRTLSFLIDGGGSAIATGIKGDIQVDFACTIQAVTILADQSGSIVVDIWKDTYANFPPTNADSICASAKPTISSAVKATDSTLTGWTTAISAGDTLRYNVDSCSTITRVTVLLKVLV